jgi:GT2 family glycosyltransferase
MLSVIVPVYKNNNLVEYCLACLSENLPEDAELILVDDSSGPETVALLKNFSGARVIEHERNLGNTVAYNSGAAVARGDILAFVDSDVFVPRGALEEFARLLSKGGPHGAVGSLLLYPYDYTIQHAGVAFDTWVLSHLFVGRTPNEISLAPVEERQAVTAAFFACRKEVYAEVGGFNETYRDGLEDIEFCLRCRELGYRNVLASRFPALHLESATRGPHKHVRRTFNYSIFFSRWAGRFTPDLCDYLRAAAEATLGQTRPTLRTALVLNFCTTPNWPDLVRVLREFGIEPRDVHDLSGGASEPDALDLFRTIPIAFQRSPLPILFVVDHFQQLMRNQCWFRRRLELDVIVDRHASVLTSERLGFAAHEL